MAVYFKFKSAKDFDSVSIDGHFISVANLKERIVEQKKLGRGSDYDLVISNAQNNEEYTDEGFMVPKNTSVIVRRVPGRPSMPIVADVKDERKSHLEVVPVNSGFQTLEPTQTNPLLSSALDGLDDFGVDLYAVPDIVQPPTNSLTEDEDNKIRAFVDSTANDWQRQTQENFLAGKGYGNKGQGRSLPLRGYGRGFEKKTPPHGYVCHRCGVTGHYIQHCPTNGDPTYDMKKVKPPTGIPKTMLVANPDGSYALPTGEVAVLKPNEAVFEREIDGLPSSNRPVLDIPPELCCPLCKGVLKEAVLTSKCCFKSYCDKCIRGEIIAKAKCVCGANNILADDLLPNMTLRDAINRFLESQASAATSSGNVGSRAQLPDMESAPYARPKASSPAVSITLKEASSALVASDGSDTNEKFAGGQDAAQVPAEVSARQGVPVETTETTGTRPVKVNGIVALSKQGIEADGSPESQLTKEFIQEIVSSERPVKTETEHRDQGLTLSEPLKGRKKPKSKRARQVDMAYSDGMWGQGPNYNNPHAENCCMHCGSFEHPSWNCYMMNGPGPSHHPPPMQGPMFGPGFNPQMRGMMHPPMGDGYMMPYLPNPGPYNAYGGFPNEFHFNGPMMPPHEPMMPHSGMMPLGPPMHRDYGDPTLMSRDEFEARKAELKRRREREQRFGREQVKYPAADAEMGPARLQGRVGPRFVSPSAREMAASPDFAEDHGVHVRSRRSSEQHPSGTKGSKVREDWLEKEEFLQSSDGDESERRDYRLSKGQDRWNPQQGGEVSSGEEVSRDGRPTRPVKQRGRTYLSKGVDSVQDGSRSGQRKSSASGYESEDDVELRIESGSHVGPSSPMRVTRGRRSVPDEPRRASVDTLKDSSRSKRQVVDRVVKTVNSRERPRASVFERTNLPLRPKRTLVDEEYDAIDVREPRPKRTKGSGGRVTEGRDQGADRLWESEDGSWQYSGSSRKRRVVEDL